MHRIDGHPVSYFYSTQHLSPSPAERHCPSAERSASLAVTAYDLPPLGAVNRSLSEASMPSGRFFRCGAAVIGLALSVGCGPGGPDVATVEGTVLLDGKPLEGAMVLFTPTAGRPAGGLTDASGHYELVYSADRGGAMLGEHTVTISTFRPGDPDEGDVGVPEKVPARYNVQSDLKRTVEDKDNVIDFELDSKGKIIEPRG
jgi:hypothetical protein